MKALSADSLPARLLARLAAAICRHPRRFIWPQVALFLVCVLYTIGFLKADMNRDNLVGHNQKYHKNFLQFQKEFPQQGDIVVVVESDNIEKNRQFVERIAAKMQEETNLFQDVFYAQNPMIMGSKGLLYASETNLVEMESMIQAARPFIQQFTETTNLVSFFEQINTAFRTAPREANADTDSLVKSLPALTRIVTQATDSLQRPGAAVAQCHRPVRYQRQRCTFKLHHLCQRPDFSGDDARAHRGIARANTGRAGWPGN